MTQGETLQLVTFKLEKEEFGVDIQKVQEINRVNEITRVPNSPPFVEGVINLRGKIVPIVDLRKRLGFNQGSYGKMARIIVAELEDMEVGFIVDSVSEVLRISGSAIEPPPSLAAGVESEYILGVGRVDDRLVILLELKKVFTIREKNEINRSELN
jgi:purine-binding chemotaxis protein CheW